MQVAASCYAGQLPCSVAPELEAVGGKAELASPKMATKTQQIGLPPDQTRKSPGKIALTHSWVVCNMSDSCVNINLGRVSRADMRLF